MVISHPPRPSPCSLGVNPHLSLHAKGRPISFHSCGTPIAIVLNETFLSPLTVIRIIFSFTTLGLASSRQASPPCNSSIHVPVRSHPQSPVSQLSLLLPTSKPVTTAALGIPASHRPAASTPPPPPCPHSLVTQRTRAMKTWQRTSHLETPDS